MTAQPKVPAVSVTVVTLTYNHSQYLAECIESVASQSRPVLEHIVYDNASTDDTSSLLAGLARRHPHLRSQRAEVALPIGKAYAEAFALARGDWIAILDGDDRWLPNRVEHLVTDSRLSRPSVSLHFADTRLIDTAGRPFGTYSAYTPPWWRWRPLARAASKPLKPLARLELMPPSPATAVRRSSLLAIGGLVLTDLPLVDLPTWLRLAESSSFAYRRGVIADYRKHPAAVTVSNGNALLDAQIEYLRSSLPSAPLSALARRRVGAGLNGLANYNRAVVAWRSGDHASARASYFAALGGSRRGTSTKALARWARCIAARR
jgi:glycosyltransferase involved in cell wall biosynthesis